MCLTFIILHLSFRLSITKTGKKKFLDFFSLFSLCSHQIKQFYMGSRTGEKKGNMEILNWKFNEQSSRHRQLRTTILRKCISNHVFHLLLWHVCWCQKRLVSLSLTKAGQQHTWMAKHGLLFRKCPATLGSSVTKLRDALFMERRHYSSFMTVYHLSQIHMKHLTLEKWPYWKMGKIIINHFWPRWFLNFCHFFFKVSIK